MNISFLYHTVFNLTKFLEACHFCLAVQNQYIGRVFQNTVTWMSVAAIRKQIQKMHIWCSTGFPVTYFKQVACFIMVYSLNTIKPYSRYRQFVTVYVLENYAARHWDMSGSQYTWYCASSHMSYFDNYCRYFWSQTSLCVPVKTVDTN